MGSREDTDTRCYRTLIYLEGDATMSVYEDANGKKQSGLNLVQTKVEVLKRPQVKEEGLETVAA